MKTQRKVAGLYELTGDACDTIRSSPYYNEDLAPTPVE